MRDNMRGLRAHMRSGLKADLREKIEFRPKGSDLRLKRANLGSLGA